MRFFAVVALMAAVSVSARAVPRSADVKALNARSGTLTESTLEVRAAPVAVVKAAPAQGAAAKKSKKSKGKKSKKSKKSKSSASSALASSSNSTSSADDAAASAAAAAAAASNSTSIDSSSSSNSTSVDNSASNSTASATSTASSATRTRPCDQGDQSLAAGLSAAVVIGMGQQAAVLTVQNTTAAADFATAVTRLQQFTDTMGLQLQMAEGIADDGSFAQVQLKLLAASQTAQETAVKALTKGDATTNAAALASLLTSFQTSTNNAQDGAEQALIDCFLPLTTLSG